MDDEFVLEFLYNNLGEDLEGDLDAIPNTPQSTPGMYQPNRPTTALITGAALNQDLKVWNKHEA